MPPIIHQNAIYDSKDMEAPQISIDGELDK